MKNYQYVYLIGVGGIGMSAIARWFNTQSIQVFGYDQAASALTDQLIKEGIGVHFQDCIDAIPKEVTHHKHQSLIVYTPAISSKNRVLNHLIANQYTVHKRAEVLEMLTQHHPTLAVAGTHGKTMTSSLAAHILYSAGKNLIAFLGGIARGYESNLLINGTIKEDTLVVIEADEFDRSFLHLRPRWAIVTTIDPDHLDTYGDEQELKKAFESFIKLVPPSGKVIVHQQVARQLHADKSDVNRITDYALTDATVRAEHVCIRENDFYFDYVGEGVKIRDVRLAVPGYHQVENALAVMTACLSWGLDAKAIRRGMATFQGVKRRFEYVIRTEQIIFLDDYAHHPVEITTLLQTIRALYPDKQITTVFQPHLYTRTQALASEFARSLDLADRVFLLDIYPAREAPIEGITSACIFDQMVLDQKWMSTKEGIIDMLAQYNPPEIIVTVGAGDISDLIPSMKHFLLTHWL
ncbi:MAG: UDP-N-acetylmuramate--L-alanine ligase [Amoebophilaceae bacterium]|jgi:UDP-N-acetylmuramate--alanine ligase|nr:UDP-N-acetylmuramate--L-alanine ligase [Amoebophilaceae bacterium]